MKSNKKAESSYGLSLKFFSLIIICAISLALILGACTQQAPEDKIDVGEEDTLPVTQPENNQQEAETPEKTEEEAEQETEEEPEEEAEPADEEEEQKQESEEPEDVTIKVYYSDSTVQYLVGEERIISTKHKYLSAFMELLKPPLEPGHIKLVPETTKVNKISFDDGNVLLDLSSEFVDDRFKSDAVDVLLVYSIVNTFTEFAGVNTVTFYVDGQRLNTIGQLDISNSLYRDTSWIKEN